MQRSAISAFTRVFDALCLRRSALLIWGPLHRGSRLCGAPLKKRCAASGTRAQTKTGPRGPVQIRSEASGAYLIFDSLNSTCLRATGSYFFLTSLSVMVREFFLAT